MQINHNNLKVLDFVWYILQDTNLFCVIPADIVSLTNGVDQGIAPRADIHTHIQHPGIGGKAAACPLET